MRGGRRSRWACVAGLLFVAHTQVEAIDICQGIDIFLQRPGLHSAIAFWRHDSVVLLPTTYIGMAMNASRISCSTVEQFCDVSPSL